MVIVVMGVTGVGKTVVGARLAEALGTRFLEGDRFHPADNVAKMRAGKPLDDVDRQPWLEAIAAELGRSAEQGETVVLACSSLKRHHRDRLRRAAEHVRFVHLTVDVDLLRARLRQREEHFMPAGLLDSQLAALEPPGVDEDGVGIAQSPDDTPESVAALALERLRRLAGRASGLR